MYLNLYMHSCFQESLATSSPHKHPIFIICRVNEWLLVDEDMCLQQVVRETNQKVRPDNLWI